MTRALRPIFLAGSELGEVRHVCAFFANDDEAYRVLLPFIRDGFACGERAVHIVNTEQRQELLQRLTADGIDTSAAQQSGQLEIQNNTEVYLRDGRFDSDRMLATFEELASGGKAAAGFPLSRIVCRMDWVSGDRSRIEDVIEFESRVGDLWRVHDDAVICTYRLSELSGADVIDILRTHPMVIIGSLLQQNPFFTRPQEFLSEYRRRHPRRVDRT
jgi:hypothetical protein